MTDFNSILLTDLYQLTMLQGYWHEQMEEEAVFELFVRKLPNNRNFLVAAGLEPALEYLERLSIDDDELSFLRESGFFSDRFLQWLKGIHFSGDVDAMPEGTVFFPDEPILRVTAPLPQAQIVETRLINLVQYSTMVATKSARCKNAAPDRALVEFGLRRAHGAEAGMLAARSSYLAGFAGTSNVLAGREYGIPIFGTMAHSYVMSHDRELDAFLGFARSQPENVVLLIDTYDTKAAVDLVIQAAEVLAHEGTSIRAVRIDAGDLNDLSRFVRQRLDASGWNAIRIFASGDLDEWKLRELVQTQQAPIDGFGVGTKLTTSQDAPYLNCAYKLEEYAGIARRKVSSGKQTWPGRKQVFRKLQPGGQFLQDTLGLASEECDGEPLLQPVMRRGKRVGCREPLGTIRQRIANQIASLPSHLLQLETAEPYLVHISPGLTALTLETDRRIGLA